MTLDPARAAVRLAVRPLIADQAGDTHLVACSGGADSLALLAACIFEGRKAGVRIIGVVVDHGLQAGSDAHTGHVVEQMAGLGADETASVRVTVDPGSIGIEAGAREARYAALAQLAEHLGASVVHLGHTRDDQAETVLLGLARGSGGRSLQGMRPSFEEDGIRFVRPLLTVTRAETEAACAADGITWWEDPQNADDGFARSRTRHRVMPVLEAELGPGIADALARTGEQLREDMDVLEPLASALHEQASVDDGVDLALLREAPVALATRVLRRVAIGAGAIANELTREHVLALLALRASKEIQLPGHLTASLDGSVLRFARRGDRPGAE